MPVARFCSMVPRNEHLLHMRMRQLIIGNGDAHLLRVSLLSLCCEGDKPLQMQLFQIGIMME